MPGTPEHPVTLGDLWKPDPSGVGICPATVADLVSALRAEGVLVVERVDALRSLAAIYRQWFPNATALSVRRHSERLFDALAEAQP